MNKSLSNHFRGIYLFCLNKKKYIFLSRYNPVKTLPTSECAKTWHLRELQSKKLAVTEVFMLPFRLLLTKKNRINLYDTRQPLLRKSRWESTRQRVIYVLEILNEQFLGAVFSPLKWTFSHSGNNLPQKNKDLPFQSSLGEHRLMITSSDNTASSSLSHVGRADPASSLTRMMGQIELGGRMWSFRGPQSHSGFTWEAHLLWSWRRRRWRSLLTAAFVSQTVACCKCTFYLHHMCRWFYSLLTCNHKQVFSGCKLVEWLARYQRC